MAGYICQGGVVRPLNTIITGFNGVNRQEIRGDAGIDSVVREIFTTKAEIEKIGIDPNIRIYTNEYDPDNSTWGSGVTRNITLEKNIGYGSNAYSLSIEDGKIKLLINSFSNEPGYYITVSVARNMNITFYMSLRVKFSDGTYSYLSNYLKRTNTPCSLTIKGSLTKNIQSETNFIGLATNWWLFGKTVNPSSITPGTIYTITYSDVPTSVSSFETRNFISDRGGNTNSNAIECTSTMTFNKITINGVEYNMTGDLIT